MLYTITNAQIKEMSQRYIDKGGEVYIIEGGLNDNYILTGHGLKTTIIKEKSLNDWSSCNVIKRYNKLPKKYAKVIEFLDNGENEKAEKLFFN